MHAELQRRARLAWGVCAICVLFLLETWNADRHRPHPASPIIWAVLGGVALLAMVAALGYGRRARAARDAMIAAGREPARGGAGAGGDGGDGSAGGRR